MGNLAALLKETFGIAPVRYEPRHSSRKLLQATSHPVGEVPLRVYAHRENAAQAAGVGAQMSWQAATPLAQSGAQSKRAD